jgi:hypothetical protein
MKKVDLLIKLFDRDLDLISRKRQQACSHFYPLHPFLHVLFCALHAFLAAFVLERFRHKV